MTSRKSPSIIASDRVLVTYASRAGSTAGVAEAIGNTLAEYGLSIDVYPMEEVHDLTPYRAVIAGSAIRYDRWLPEAMTFVKHHQDELKQKPFAAFLVCLAMTSNTARARRTASSYLQPVRDLVEPMSEGLFAGVLNVRKLPEPHFRIAVRAITALGIFKQGDYRDWNAIHDWAKDLSITLQETSKILRAG